MALTFGSKVIQGGFADPEQRARTLPPESPMCSRVSVDMMQFRIRGIRVNAFGQNIA